MYESEVNETIESAGVIPREIRVKLSELRDRIEFRSLLPWGEHCTECVWPTCYQTCDLYTPREDGGCRQFLEGMVRVDCKEGLNPYLLKVHFKRWGKLWTPGTVRMTPLRSAKRTELVNIAVGAVGRSLPLPARARQRLLQKINYLRRKNAEASARGPESPDYFLLECYNPATANVPLTFTIRNGEGSQRSFQRLINAEPGYTRTQISFAEIQGLVDTRRPFEVEITPNCDGEALLYFGLIDFVREKRSLASLGDGGAPGPKLKCIVWDLDHTIWDGILVEDGVDKLRLRPGIVEVLRATDERGILNSIASKNNPEDALEALRRFGIDEYFLYPQIGWRPKSMAIADIVRLLNIGVDTIAFVDDQPFEREEVQSVHGEVLAIDAADVAQIPAMQRCQVPVTDESKTRRLMYRQEERRGHALQSYAGDYAKFLLECRIQVRLLPLTDDRLMRVFELAQRTNQLNFSGNRYSVEELRSLMQRPEIDCYVIECEDRFGAYGIVGFAVINRQGVHLLDLMFSCRVQGKRVEHAVLRFLVRKYFEEGAKRFVATYRRTKKNAPSGRVFEELGFAPADPAQSESSTLEFRGDPWQADDGIISVALSKLDGLREAAAPSAQ